MSRHATAPRLPTFPACRRSNTRMSVTAAAPVMLRRDRGEGASKIAWSRTGDRGCGHGLASGTGTRRPALHPSREGKPPRHARFRRTCAPRRGAGRGSRWRPGSARSGLRRGRSPRRCRSEQRQTWRGEGVGGAASRRAAERLPGHGRRVERAPARRSPHAVLATGPALKPVHWAGCSRPCESSAAARTARRSAPAPVHIPRLNPPKKYRRTSPRPARRSCRRRRRAASPGSSQSWPWRRGR